MTNEDFAKLRSNMLSLEKVFTFTANKMITVIINGEVFSKLKSEGNLTKAQLEYFEFLDDFVSEYPLSL